MHLLWLPNEARLEAHELHCFRSGTRGCLECIMHLDGLARLDAGPAELLCEFREMPFAGQTRLAQCFFGFELPLNRTVGFSLEKRQNLVHLVERVETIVPLFSIRKHGADASRNPLGSVFDDNLEIKFLLLGSL